MVNDLGGQTVVIVFREDDEDGDYRDTGERLPVPGCSVQPGAPGESGGNQERTTLPVAVFGPMALARARSWDELLVDGWLVGLDDPIRVELAGPPAVWPDENGAPHHVEVAALYTRG